MAPNIPDVPQELLTFHHQLECQFRSEHDLDVNYPPDPDDPELEDPNRARFENATAKELLAAVDTLVASQRLIHWREKLSGVFPIGQLGAFLATLRLVKPQLQFDLAKRDLEDLSAKVDRAVQLAAVLLEPISSERARSYLRRVSRCYVAGLEPECLIMCRAVLDAAFEDRISDADVERHLPSRRKSRNIPFADRITAAQAMGLIDPQLSETAKRLKDAGNDALHNVPVPTISTLEAVQGTARVLAAIAA